MPPLIYGNHATTDIEAIIRRSEVELAAYELKQGLLTLDDKRTIDTNLVDKVLKTICAIANNGPNQTGKILIGVTDSAEDAARVATLDGVKPRKVGKRSVVGINREAQAMKLSTEEYFGKWKNAIKDSGLSTAVKQSVLSNIDFNAFYGMGVLVVTITPQKELSYFNEELYWREGDSTKKAETPKQIAALAQRF